MSGGAYGYKYFKIIEFAEEMQLNDDPLRIAFQKHLMLVAKACKAIEWEDSGDTSKEHTDESILAAFSYGLGFSSPTYSSDNILSIKSCSIGMDQKREME